MTKKDFEFLAQAIAILIENGIDKTVCKHFAEAIADYCALTNPNFNRLKFLKDCGL